MLRRAANIARSFLPRIPAFEMFINCGYRVFQAEGKIFTAWTKYIPMIRDGKYFT